MHPSLLPAPSRAPRPLPRSALALTLAFAAAGLAAAGPAHAEDAVKLEIVRKGQIGQSKPALIVRAQQAATALDVSLGCGAVKVARHGGATAGEAIRLDLDLAVGAHTCKGSLSVVLGDGSEGVMPLSFQVEVLRPLVITVDRDSVDLRRRELELSLDRSPGRIDIVAYDPDGQKIGGGTMPVSGVGPGSPVRVGWQSEGDTLRLEVVATDTDGFSSKLDLFPWSYAIPHEDVIFASNEAVVQPGETAKLKAAQGEVNTVVKRYGAFATVNLYIGGYTDTVGNPGHNQTLSEQRAQAIARWFKEQGFSGQIWYQGFGERGLAVPTADEVDEARNRRALYIVAADTPNITAEMPASSWKALK